ncbi:MAG: tetratricopeptide repeat protein [Candidatus Obscuribacterales bacterium]|nr:tetratricopeptide repeat protein [Candidatus Obscuribacterales bacterium]
MKAAVAALALACLLFQTSGLEALCLETGPMAPYAGSPISPVQTLGYPGTAMHRQAESLCNYAYSLIENGSFTEAEKALRQALNFENSSIVAHCNLGFILNRTGRAREALSHLLYAYQRVPNHPAVLQSLAASYQLQAQFSQAIQLYRQYLSSFPQAGDSRFVAEIIRNLEKESAVSSNSTQIQNYSWSNKKVRVYIHAANNVRGFQPAYNEILQDSFLRWSQSGVLSFEFVNSPANADIECVWTDDAGKLASIGEGGETVLRHQGKTVSHAKIILLTRRLGSTARLSSSEINALCLHEIGHALGMVKHSPHPEDVMFCTLSSAVAPSSCDYESLKDLYPNN